MNVLTKTTQSIFHLFYPNNCEACGVELVGNEKLICIACWKDLPKTFFHRFENNPIEKKFWGKVKIEHACSMYYFNKDARIQHLLHALKYKHKKEVGIALGRRIAKQLQESEWINEIDSLIPIPLSKQKLKLRGYNQSELIAQGMHDILNIEIDTLSVQRKKNTRTQTQMTKAERIENMKDAFEIHPNHLLTQKHILLIDDVITTGATIESCAEPILQLGNTKISILTVACAIV